MLRCGDELFLLLSPAKQTSPMRAFQSISASIRTFFLSPVNGRDSLFYRQQCLMLKFVSLVIEDESM